MFKPTEFPSQAKQQVAMKQDLEDMKHVFDHQQFFSVFLAERTKLSYSALSMKSLWLARTKKIDRKLKSTEKLQQQQQEEE